MQLPQMIMQKRNLGKELATAHPSVTLTEAHLKAVWQALELVLSNNVIT